VSPGVIAERRLIDPEAKKMWRIAGFTGAVGIEVALAITIGYFGGQWLDRKLGTYPVITIIGFVGGVGAAIKALIRVTRDYQKELKEEEQTETTEETQAPEANQHPKDPNAH
jgi:F0F1-type ATP synthase assembly protein I